MSIIQRRFIRFSLDIPAIRHKQNGESFETALYQISIGGCLLASDEKIFVGDEFRLEINLPNGNRLPLHCRALYKFPGKGIGTKFIEISEFEQELLADIISEILEKEGLPLQVDPFAHPPDFVQGGISDLHKANPEMNQAMNQRLLEEAMFEEILSLDQ